jgi:hypothetical protein
MLGQPADLFQQRSCFVRIAEFVDVFHVIRLPLIARRRRQRAPLIGEQRMHQVPQDVIDRDVGLLDAMNAVARHHQAVIERDPVAISPPSCPARPMVTSPISRALMNAFEQVLELPLVDTPISIAATRLRHQLPHEDMIEADVVADSRHHRRYRRRG